MTDAREIIAQRIAGPKALGWADAVIEALHAAGIRLAGPDDRILGPDEVDQVTVEKCAAIARECFDDPQAEADPNYIAAAIHSIGRKA